jgi:hypothetical protein
MTINALKGRPSSTFSKNDKGGNIGAFKSELDAAFVELMGGVNEAMIQLANEVLVGVEAKSPVDTGHFRANWLVSVGQPNASVAEWTKLEKEAKSGPSFGKDNITTITGYVGQDGEWPVLIIQNNLPYALRLEHGWSSYAPLGMVELTLLEAAGQWDATTL